MNKIFRCIIILTIILLCFSSCKNKKVSISDSEEKDLYDFEANYNGKRVGVIYFSITGNTKNIAEKIANIFDVRTHELIPEKRYTEDDINNSPDSRARLEAEFDVFGELVEIPDPKYDLSFGIATPSNYYEMDSENKIKELPKIRNINVKPYDIIFLGYPIWYDEAPKVLYTFINNKELEGKVIIPFCTSDNSDIGISDQNLSNYAPPKVNFMAGKRFDKDATEEEVREWIVRLGADIEFD